MTLLKHLFSSYSISLQLGLVMEMTKDGLIETPNLRHIDKTSSGGGMFGKVDSRKVRPHKPKL